MPTGILDGPAQRFTEFADTYLKGLFEFMPSLASSMGLHEYDGRTPDMSKQAIQARVSEIDNALVELDSLDTTEFDLDMLLDYDLLRYGMEMERFRIGEQREHTYNPLFVLWIVDVMNYLKRDYAPAEERVHKLIEYERGIPELMSQVTELLELPLSKTHIHVAIQFCGGQLTYMRDDLPKAVAEQIDDPELLAQFTEANGPVIEALDAYV